MTKQKAYVQFSKRIVLLVTIAAVSYTHLDVYKRQTIDKLNRTTFSAVKLGSKTFTSEYHFAAGGYGTGSVTNLVASITQPGCNCGYGYDDNGNIASATLNGRCV